MHGSVGDGSNFHGLSPGIHFHPTQLGGRKGNAHSSGSVAERGAREGVTRPSVKEGRNKDDGPGRSSFPIVLLPSAQIGQCLATDSKPKAIERQLHPATEFPHGNPGRDHSHSTEGNVGGVNRLSGCIPSYSSRLSFPTLPRLQLPREVVQVYGSALRPIHVTTGIYPGGRGGRSRIKKAGSYVVRLYRRLAHPWKHGESVSEQRRRNDQPPTVARLADQLGEVASHPDTDTCILGRDARPSRGKSFPNGHEIRVIKRLNPGHRVRSIQPGQGLVKDARTPIAAWSTSFPCADSA